MELKEANKAAIQRVKDKKDDLAAKNAVRLQIAADKTARAERNAREKALRDGTAIPLSASDAASSSTSSVSAVKAGSKSTAGGMVRVQIRLPSGRNAMPLVLTMDAGKTLQDLVDYAFEKSGIPGLRAQDFTCAFPRYDLSLLLFPPSPYLSSRCSGNRTDDVEQRIENPTPKPTPIKLSLN